MTSPGTEAGTAMSDPAQPTDLGAGPEGGESYGGPPEPPPNLTSNRRLQQTQAEVDQVVDILRDTVTKTLERDVIISSLDDKADALHESSKVFENSATALARKYWCQDMKMMIILGVICGIVAIAIVGKRLHVPGESTKVDALNLQDPAQYAIRRYQSSHQL